VLANLAIVELSDGRFQRMLWSGVRGVGGLLGPRRGRLVAATLLRLSCRSERGWLRGLYRVARFTSSPAPSLVKLPERWSAEAPLVRSRRLGLDLQLDLRDNLQRTLFYTGTYEPGLLGFLHDQLRCGDVAVDVGAHIGVHALTMARRLDQLGGGRVLAFEPAQDSAAKLRAAATRNLWVPKTPSPHATWAYSWISPPTRSSLTTGKSAAGAGGGMTPSGGPWSRERCGRCWL
jgi:hypothetical protein